MMMGGLDSSATPALLSPRKAGHAGGPAVAATRATVGMRLRANANFIWITLRGVGNNRSRLQGCPTEVHTRRAELRESPNGEAKYGDSRGARPSDGDVHLPGLSKRWGLLDSLG
jgi:hypothetical protein